MHGADAGRGCSATAPGAPTPPPAPKCPFPPPPPRLPAASSAQLPRATPPRLRFVPRGAPRFPAAASRRAGSIAPTPRGSRGGTGLRRPGWSRHRGERTALVCFGLGNDSFMADVALLRYREDPHPHTQIYPTRGRAPTPPRRAKPHGRRGCLQSSLRINFYIASRREAIKLFVSKYLFRLPPLFLRKTLVSQEHERSCPRVLGCTGVYWAAGRRGGNRGVFFSRGGAASRGNLIPVRGSCCSGEGEIDSATAQRPVWPQPNSSCIILFKKQKQKQKTQKLQL